MKLYISSYPEGHMKEDPGSGTALAPQNLILELQCQDVFRLAGQNLICKLEQNL